MRKKPIDWAIVTLAILVLLGMAVLLLEGWGKMPRLETAIEIAAMLYTIVLLWAYSKGVL